MYLRISLFICFILYLPPVFAQLHLEPPNGEDGIPGPVSGSFIIKWASVDSATSFEYVMSDNPNCFSGCAGDTRQEKVIDTIAIESNLRENTWYYWITRIYYPNGDTSNWSNISSFLAKTPEAVKMVKIAPKPLRNNSIIVNIDWLVNPKAQNISFELYSIKGQKTGVSAFIEKNNSSRYQSYTLPLNSVSKGIYIAVFIVYDNPNNPNNKIICKIVVP